MSSVLVALRRLRDDRAPAIGLALLVLVTATVFGVAPRLIDRVAIPFYVSGLVGGPAYVPFAAVLLWWLRKEPAERYRAISWIAPLLFVPPFLLYLFVTRWWTGSTAPLLDTLIFYGLLVLVVGYGYVVLIHAGRRALDRWGAIETTGAGVR